MQSITKDQQELCIVIGFIMLMAWLFIWPLISSHDSLLDQIDRLGHQLDNQRKLLTSMSSPSHYRDSLLGLYSDSSIGLPDIHSITSSNLSLSFPRSPECATLPIHLDEISQMPFWCNELRWTRDTALHIQLRSR